MVSVAESSSGAECAEGFNSALNTADDGHFRFERAVPGQRYTANIYENSHALGIAFENLTLHPGETRNVGDIHIKPTASSRN